MSIPLTSTTGPLVVQTDAGPVAGVVSAGTRTWRGIPFAAPPVGALRFRAPQPVEAWTGVREASDFGAVPPQTRANPLMSAGKRMPMDEDCLTINITAPLDAGAEPLPVVVYFYGGAYSMGASSMPLYRGDGIARQGRVIYVSLNYRLGALGFFDFRAYGTPEHPIEANLGLRDQVAGLEWVQRNIRSFGGDPDNVTIFGESAGGMSVTTLMTVPSAAGLFHRGFAQSPPAAAAYGPELHARWAAALLDILGLRETDAVGRLFELPAEQFVPAVETLSARLGETELPGTLCTSPVIDGEFLPKHPVTAFQDGDAHDVPLVIGTMKHEGAFFARFLDALPSTPARIERMFRETDPDAHDRVVAAYPGYPSKQAGVDIGGDIAFWFPSILVAEAHSRRSPTWFYRFDYSPPAMRAVGMRATHGVDVPAMFGETDTGISRLMNIAGGARTSRALSRRFQGALVEFAYTGSLTDWPEYDEASRRTKVFDAVDRIEADPHRERRLAWGDFRGGL